MTWRILLLILLLTVPAHAGEETSADGSYFATAIAYYDEGNYAEALRSLSAAYEADPSVGDYSLLYTAKSYLQTGDTTNALKSLEKLYGTYPDSPLIEEARGLEVVAALQRNEHAALGLLRKYTRDYPADMEMKFLLAGLLKETGRLDEAKQLFKEIYIAACPISLDARAELEPTDLTAGDLLERGTNLMRNRQYHEAERALRAALGRGDRDLRKSITEQFALSLFRQKKYGEASGLLVEVGDLYNAARSFIRSGNQEEFEKAMNRLAATRDPKGARLMIAYANELRREGEKDEALALLRRVKKIYRDWAEEALWNEGWLYYMSGDFGKARKTFRRLYSKYKSPKYLYWQARASEKAGKDAGRLYEKLDDKGFYGILAGLKTGRLETSIGDEATGLPRPGRMDRVDILIEAGLKDYAVKELILRAERKNDNRSLRDIAIKLMELQEYRRAILVTSTLPEKMQHHEILYPLAFWPRVTSAAADHGIDPFLLLSLIREESRFDPEALSPAGAVGLMQLMPQTAKVTARSLQVSVDGPQSLTDADLNIKLGSQYLSVLLRQFDSVPPALAAYNAGAQRVEKWLSEYDYESYDEFIEDIPFEETRNYVKRIVSTYYRYRLTRAPEQDASLEIL